MKVKEAIKRLEGEGWLLARKTAGSHRAYVHPDKPGTVVVISDHGANADLKPGTFNNIAKAAGWKK